MTTAQPRTRTTAPLLGRVFYGLIKKEEAALARGKSDEPRCSVFHNVAALRLEGRSPKRAVPFAVCASPTP